jgi:hypothetical protein|tara:strand:- start:956 stop:1357 length:402 start_codon:yes stop_codon:yes gene_type:complete
MSGTIQVKRSANTSAPTALEFGELAWASNGQVLHIGREDSDTSNLVAIGGIRSPGTLTANQALVTNSSSSINEIKAANVYFDTIKQAVNTEANVTMTGTSTANLYNVHVRGSLKDSNGNALEIYNSSGTKIWG